MAVILVDGFRSKHLYIKSKTDSGTWFQDKSDSDDLVVDMLVLSLVQRSFRSSGGTMGEHIRSLPAIVKVY